MLVAVTVSASPAYESRRSSVNPLPIRSVMSRSRYPGQRTSGLVLLPVLIKIYEGDFIVPRKHNPPMSFH